MRFNNLFAIYKRTAIITHAFIRHVRCNQIYSSHFLSHAPKLVSSVQRRVGTIQEDSFDEIDYTGYTARVDEENARDLLFNNSKDLLLSRIYCCASVQELFKVLNTNVNYYNSEHITQTVLVLHDLMRIYCDVNYFQQAALEFCKKLNESASFHKLLQLVEENVQYFDTESLSYTLLYLNKLGLSVESTLMQQISDCLKRKLLETFTIASASRFLEFAFSDTSLRSYFMSQELVPLVLHEIDCCDSRENLNHLSVSLSKLHSFVRNDDLDKYKTRVESMLENGKITSTHYKLILQIVSVMSYPKWRDKNSVLISRCILLMKDNLNALSANEIMLLYEIFFKTQEPGDILSDLQRAASTHFHQLEDSASSRKIALFYTLVYYASPHLKTEFQKIAIKYVKQCDNYDDLLLLRKPLTFLKISDMDVCRLYWDKMLRFVKSDWSKIDVVKLCQNYMAFYIQIDNYRHAEFEKEVVKVLNTLSKDVSYDCFPHKISDVLNFVLLFGDDLILLEQLVDKLEANCGQLRHLHTLRMALTLKTFDEMDKNYINLPYAQRVNRVYKKIILRQVQNTEFDSWTLNALVKACILKRSVDWSVVDHLLNQYKSCDAFSSKTLENVVFCCLTSNTLIPDVLNRATDYMVANKSHVLGFNFGKTLYLCYVLGYQPKDADRFFETVVDAIIRNQERMSGLAVIYCALSLCFFNKLSNSIIKSIFNVEFMDKLDKELQNCYSRDKYPQRVRNYLMQLNRAVCLDYPESNVPWFHQKYVEEDINSRKKRKNVFVNNVRECLNRIVFNTNGLAENVVTPYGYTIDFVVYLDSHDEISIDPTEFSRRLAVLLMYEHSYTRIEVQLKGQAQLKKRHLEILGYKVVIVKYSDWMSLYYSEERLNFLGNLLWPKKISDMNKKNSM